MRPVSVNEFARMRSTQGESMGDMCKVGVLSSTVSGGHVSESYTYGTEIACGFDAAPSGESNDGAQVGKTGAALRLPIGTAVASNARIQITSRNGTALGTPEYYSVDGDPRRGPTCLTLDLVVVHGSRRA